MAKTGQEAWGKANQVPLYRFSLVDIYRGMFSWGFASETRQMSKAGHIAISKESWANRARAAFVLGAAAFLIPF